VRRGENYLWDQPKGFPAPPVPSDNPMTAAKVELGRHLFYDPRMSVNGKSSCATCHRQELAFTDGRAVAVGTTGEHHTRGAMSLVNIAYSAALTWNTPGVTRLEDQALVPMFGEHPVELGLREGDGFLPALRADTKYRVLFERAFPDETDRFTIANVARAIACFERSIVSARSPYDLYHFDRDDSAVSAKRGEILFFSQQQACFRSHGGVSFSGAGFHNNGLSARDATMFKAPTLRNIAVTAPYMHDGSVATLEAVIDHYAAGGKAGHDNPHESPLIAGFHLTAEERLDLIAFLQSLTDEAVLRDPRFANPW